MEIPEHARAAIAGIRELGDDELVSSMLSTFVRFADAQLERFEEAVASGDFTVAAGIARTLETSGRLLGASPFGDACADAELAGRGGDAAGLRAASAAMRSAFAASRAWMGALAAN